MCLDEIDINMDEIEDYLLEEENEPGKNLENNFFDSQNIFEI